MDTITLTNTRLLDFQKALEAVKHLKGAKFGYAVSRSLRSIDPFVKSLMDAGSYGPDYTEFLQAKEEIGLPFAVTSQGNPLYDIYNGELFLQILAEKSAVFTKKYESLKKKFSKAILDNESQQKEYRELLKQQVSVEVFNIDIELLPEEISFGQAFRLLPMIQAKEMVSPIPCSFPNQLILNFPSQLLRNYAGVVSREFTLAMLENFRILDLTSLDMQQSEVAKQYSELYEEGRIALCEKFASRNEYGNPAMVATASGVEYSIPESLEYAKAMKLFKGGMKEIVSAYEKLLKGQSFLHLSPITFDHLPEDFSATQIDILAELIRE